MVKHDGDGDRLQTRWKLSGDLDNGDYGGQSRATNHDSNFAVSSIMNHESPIMSHSLFMSHESFTSHESPIMSHESPIMSNESRVINSIINHES
jgi:hypothetical protein